MSSSDIAASGAGGKFWPFQAADCSPPPARHLMHPDVQSSLRFAPGSKVPIHPRRVMKSRLKYFAAALFLLWSKRLVCSAQSAPTPQTPDTQNPAPRSHRGSDAAPTAPATPPITVRSLQGAPPAVFDAGPFGKIDVNGVLSGVGMWQGNHIPATIPRKRLRATDRYSSRKTDGWSSSSISRPVLTRCRIEEAPFFQRTRR